MTRLRAEWSAFLCSAGLHSWWLPPTTAHRYRYHLQLHCSRPACRATSPGWDLTPAPLAFIRSMSRRAIAARVSLRFRLGARRLVN